MAGFIRYEQAPVAVGIGGADCELLATTATAGENLPLTPVRALGFNGAVAVTSNGPVDGSFSVTYHIVKNKMPNAGCRSGDSVPTGSTCDNLFGPASTTDAAFVMARSFANPLSMKVAGTELFSKGMANSFSVTAEPNAVITATLAGNFFDCRMAPNGGDLTAAAVKTGVGDFAVAHGATSGATSTGLGFSCDPFTATYEFSRGFNPIYSLGKLDAVFIMVTDPQVSLSMQGENLPASVLKESESGSCAADSLCLDKADISFQIKDVCNNALADYSVCGFIASRDIEVAENDVLRGNITVTDYSFPQEVDTVSCD